MTKPKPAAPAQERRQTAKNNPSWNDSMPNPPPPVRPLACNTGQPARPYPVPPNRLRSGRLRRRLRSARRPKKLERNGQHPRTGVGTIRSRNHPLLPRRISGRLIALPGALAHLLHRGYPQHRRTRRHRRIQPTAPPVRHHHHRKLRRLREQNRHLHGGMYSIQETLQFAVGICPPLR